MPLGNNKRYNANIFGIYKNHSTYAMEQDTGIFPGAHENYLVYNIGRTEVFVRVKYGTKVMWHGDIASATIQPGERRILRVGGRPYYVTGLYVYNKTDTRAIVHCADGDDSYRIYTDKEPGTFDEVRNKLIKEVCVLGVSYVPYLGAGLAGLLGAFWPDTAPSVWEQVQDKVKPLINEKVLQTISGILDGDLRYYKERISVLLQDIKDGVDRENVKLHYMNIAQDLIGFEKKFIFGKNIPDHETVNQLILPIYSALILMKISFYVIGIQRQNEIGLLDEDIRTIKSYANRAVHGDNGANKYITKLYKERVDNAYSTKFSEDLYDNMMNVRTYIATQGLEYIPIWNHMLENPTDTADAYNDVISFSTLYGRQTADMIKMAIPDEVPEPLTPKLIDGKRNKITYLDVYLWRIHNGQGEAKIGGLKIYFENDETFTMGTMSRELRRIDFDEALLNKLEVYGDGAIDQLKFHFSDDRTFTFGERSYHNHHTVFELKDHHIVSFYLATDNNTLGGQAANISVAYQLIPKS